MQKIYYDKTRNLEVVDVSGKKTLLQIKKEFGEFDYQEIEIDESKEDYSFKEGIITKRAKLL